MKRVAVDRLPSEEPVAITAERSHHLIRVCRLGVGDSVLVFDGQGGECPAEIVAIDDGIATIRATGSAVEARPTLDVQLVLGLPRGPATDDAIRMATEVGATAIHPVWAARTQGRPDRTDRWRRIAESAAAQCGRADVPLVTSPRLLGEVLHELGDTQLFIALPGSEIASPRSRSSCAVLIGPEGGWSPDEIELALGHGAAPIGLGEWVLRTPTAAAVAIARLV